MTEGYVSDVSGDETVMDSPDATVRIDIADLPPEQAFAIAQEAGETQLTDAQRGKLADGQRLSTDYSDVTFHLPLGYALTALASVNAIDLPEEPPEDVDVEANDE